MKRHHPIALAFRRPAAILAREVAGQYYLAFRPGVKDYHAYPIRDRKATSWSHGSTTRNLSRNFTMDAIVSGLQRGELQLAHEAYVRQHHPVEFYGAVEMMLAIRKEEKPFLDDLVQLLASRGGTYSAFVDGMRKELRRVLSTSPELRSVTFRQRAGADSYVMNGLVLFENGTLPEPVARLSFPLYEGEPIRLVFKGPRSRAMVESSAVQDLLAYLNGASPYSFEALALLGAF